MDVSISILLLNRFTWLLLIYKKVSALLIGDILGNKDVFFCYLCFTETSLSINLNWNNQLLFFITCSVDDCIYFHFFSDGVTLLQYHFHHLNLMNLFLQYLLCDDDEGFLFPQYIWLIYFRLKFFCLIIYSSMKLTLCSLLIKTFLKFDIKFFVSLIDDLSVRVFFKLTSHFQILNHY